MLTVPVRREMPVDADVAWDLLIDTERWTEWGPSIDRVDVGARLLAEHSTGRVRTALGIWAPFRITRFEPGRSWAWAVAGVPATTHLVEPTAHGCRVTFGVPATALPYVPVCALALRRIEHLARATAGR